MPRNQLLEPTDKIASGAPLIRRGLCLANRDDGVAPRIPLPDPIQAERGSKRRGFREGIEEEGLQLHPNEGELRPVQAERQAVTPPKHPDDPEGGNGRQLTIALPK